MVEPGDRIEVRGPIGGPFTWTRDLGGPLFLVAGGSGIAPIMSMVRHRRSVAPEIPARLLYSSRSLGDIIYREELERRAAEERLEVVYTLTRAGPADWTGYSRRIDQLMLGEALAGVEGTPLSYVCGPTALVEAVADGLVALGVPPGRVHTERFGPTGG